MFCLQNERPYICETCGKSFNGMQVEIMDPDFVSGDGEIVIHSRNVFMGYAKVLEEIQ